MCSASADQPIPGCKSGSLSHATISNASAFGHRWRVLERVCERAPQMAVRVDAEFGDRSGRGLMLDQREIALLRFGETQKHGR
jgi:hypothetical protein